MQNTRLNRLFDETLARSTRWLRNPWRRLSCLIIGLLFGNFLALVLSTTSGQTAELDVQVAILMVVGVEGINWLVYRRRSLPADSATPRVYWFIEILNTTKMGFLYGMFVQAQILGS